MKICPECKQQFADEHDFCPHHGTKLLSLAPGTLFAGESPASMVTVMAAPAFPQAENYDRYIGQILDGRYFLEEKLGEGGMGVVFKAHHTVIERTVAVKILKKEVARDQAVVQRFQQEARAASRIGHGSIVEVTDFGRLSDGSAYSVMEFIDGDTLNKVMKPGPISAARALPIAGQIARALAAAHDKGIVHRDLKPENIFLVVKDGRRDLVKIVDFGIAKIMPVGANLDGPRLTRAGSIFGTPEYMAPEQAAGRSDNDHRVDIYALGTILYEMLVGRVPHKGETVVATLAQQMLDPIVPPRRMNPNADISDALEAVIMTALAKDRDKRYHSMGDFWVSLESASGGVPLEPIGGGLSARSSDPGPTPQGIPTFIPPNPTDQVRQQRRPNRQTGGTLATVPDLHAGQMAELNIARRAAKRRRSRVLVIGAIIAAAAVAGVTVAVISRRGGNNVVNNGAPDAGGTIAVKPPPAALDAGSAVVVVPATAADAGVAVVTMGAVDAGQGIALLTKPDAGRAIYIKPPHPNDTTPHQDPIDPNILISIKVTTDPGGASLFIGGEPTQNDGATIRRPKGTRLEVRCGIPGSDRWEKGHVTLLFNGRGTEVTCKMARKTDCVDELKSPYPCAEN